MDLLKKADSFFRVILRERDRINNSTRQEPEFNIKGNYQEQYKFYNRCIMKIDDISVPRTSSGLGQGDTNQETIYVKYNGSQSNSYDSSTDDMTQIVSIITTPFSSDIKAESERQVHLPCEITNIFGPVKFRFDNVDWDTQDNDNVFTYTIAYTLYFYKV